MNPIAASTLRTSFTTTRSLGDRIIHLSKVSEDIREYPFFKDPTNLCDICNESTKHLNLFILLRTRHPSVLHVRFGIDAELVLLSDLIDKLSTTVLKLHEVSMSISSA
jgi:hypothetical protein